MVDIYEDLHMSRANRQVTKTGCAACSSKYLKRKKPLSLGRGEEVYALECLQDKEKGTTLIKDCKR